jgi:DNA oxidative demethylase
MRRKGSDTAVQLLLDLPEEPRADLPDGFLYRPELVTDDEEAELLDRISLLSFSEVRMHGVVARRRVAHFGWHYHFDSRGLTPGPEPPEFLLPLRDRVASLGNRTPEEYSEALVTEYSPGSAIGWHRDAPPFGVIAGISLGAPCRFRLRPRAAAGAPADATAGERPRTAVVTVELRPRSAYVLDGPARTSWEHSIPPVKALR